MTTDFRTAKILSHRRNIQRYSRLLATKLTHLERQYLHNRIAEEHAELERIEGQEFQSKSDEGHRRSTKSDEGHHHSIGGGKPK